MAHVSSMTYTTELQFYEAVAQAKAAQSTRQEAQAMVARQNAVSFQDVLNTSISGLNATTTHISGEAALQPLFQKAADTYNISIDLIKAVARQESGFQSNIVSSAGAIGVMQLMPSTASYLGVTNPYDPEQNIMGGAKLLAELYEKYNGNIDYTLAAYNAGSGAVERYGGVPPFAETQNYVAKIKASLGLF